MSDWVVKTDNIEETKKLIKEAIVFKGVSVSDTDSFRSYASKIEQISGGDRYPKYNGPLSVSPTTEMQILSTAYKSVLGNIAVMGVTSNIDANIQPENIRKDISILGVKGTLDEGNKRLPDYDGPVIITPTVDGQALETANKSVTENIIVDAVSSNIDSNIKSENIKKDISILGVTGTYIGEGQKLPDYTGKITIDPSIETQVLNTKNKTVNNDITIKAVTSNIDVNIQPGNIRKGVQILGVTGNVEEGAGPDLNQSIIYKFDPGMSSFNSKLAIEVDLRNFNTASLTSTREMFYQYQNITSLDLSNFNTSKVTDMAGMFNSCMQLTSLNLSNFDTSNVTNMNEMFTQSAMLTSINLSSFNTSKVKGMSMMFHHCYNLPSLDLSSFDTSQVTNMRGMFGFCANLKSLDLSNFNTLNVEWMNQMFDNCANLTSIKGIENFTTDNVIYMNYMFNCCQKLKSLDLSNWQTGNVIDMGYMFADCANLETIIWGNNWASNPKVKIINLIGESSYQEPNKITHDSLLDLFNKLAKRTNNPTLQLTSTLYNKMTATEIKIAQDKGWNVVKA